MFGTQLPFLRRFCRLSLVSVLSNMMVPLAGLVDTAFLGHLADINQLAGVILGSILFDYLYRILKFLRSSTNALAAAATDDESAWAVLLRSGTVALAIGLGLLLLQYPLRVGGFWLLTNVPELQATGAAYFDGRIWGAPAVLGNFVFIGWFLGREQAPVVLAMSLVGNGLNVVLDYLWIPLWGSGGAGLATAASQYGALAVGATAALRTSGWRMPSLKSWFTAEAFRQTLALKGNLLIRFFLLISVYAIFTNLSARLGTTYLALNGLLLQIALLSQFTIQGVGLTTQTLVGSFQKEGETSQILPLMKVSMLISGAIALTIALVTIVFPGWVFHLLTNHEDIQMEVLAYDRWLLPVLLLTASAFMLEGYFIGIRAGAVLRNSCLASFLVFVAIALLGWVYQSNDLLWGALTVYMGGLTLALGWRFFQIHRTVPTSSAI
ncbi:MAG: MATE family efflux transporter [Pseudanabaenaceae cyanobacterium]